VWSQAQIIIHMANGDRLTIPATTTYKQVAFLKDDYYKVLAAEASAQMAPYVLGIIVAWLLPFPVLLILGLAVDLVYRIYRHCAQNDDSELGVVVNKAASVFRRRSSVPCNPCEASVFASLSIAARKGSIDNSLSAFGRG
jgi:hypothetical protein